MLRLVLARLVQGLATLVILTLIVFLVTRVIGNPISQLLPPDHTPEEYARMARILGYDRPLWVQYGDFLAGALKGDFGWSVTFQEPATAVVLERVPITAGLAFGALLLASLIGIPLGILAGVRPGSRFDRIAIGLAALGQATPTFLVAMLLILVFSTSWRILPATGAETPAHLILPTISIAVWAIAALSRFARSGVLETMSKPFITLARAKGLRERQLLRRHALRISLLPVVTFGGLQLGMLLSGAVVTESVFAIPGIGKLALDAVRLRDLDLVAAVVMIGASFLILANIVTDLVSLMLDPRLRPVSS